MLGKFRCKILLSKIPCQLRNTSLYDSIAKPILDGFNISYDAS